MDFSNLVRFGSVFNPKYPVPFFLVSVFAHHRDDPPIVHVDMTLTQSKVKVTGLLNFRKFHFSRSISSAILVWSSKLMVGSDSMGPGLQFV